MRELRNVAESAEVQRLIPKERAETGWQEELSDMASFLDENRAQKLLSEIRAAGETPRGDQFKAKLFNDCLVPILQAIIAKKLKASYPYDPESVAERVWDTACTQVLVYLDKQARGEKEEPGSVCDYVATLTYHAISLALLRYIAHPMPVEPFVRALAEASGETTEKLSADVMPSALQRIAALPNITLSEKERLLSDHGAGVAQALARAPHRSGAQVHSGAPIEWKRNARVWKATVTGEDKRRRAF